MKEDPIYAGRGEGKLVVMRGLPGSGRAAIARKLGGEIFSADKYFMDSEGNYNRDSKKLGLAHKWNQTQANDAMIQRIPLVIVDNVNLRGWQMKPYVESGLNQGYEINLVMPDSPESFDPIYLEKVNKHKIPLWKL